MPEPKAVVTAAVSAAVSAAAATAAPVDVLVVGGGINGAGIARDLAGRGLGVVLVEQDDLAAHTSSASTKLVHGGLRYLEYYEFSLVRKALAEREVLLRAAPHIMRPLRFVMPHDPSMRPVWMIRAGLFLYDHLARRELLPGSQTVRLAEHPAGAALKPEFRKGFVYSDAWVDDARLVVLNAVDAAGRGARVFTRTRCTRVRSEGGLWHVELEGQGGAPAAPGAAITPSTLSARALVNATGPWAAQFLRGPAGKVGARALRLVKGSHIVVPKVFSHDHAYIFQNADGRIIFAIPYEGDFTLIGTTDVEWPGEAAAVRIDDDEIAYLCEQVSRYLARPVRPRDVVWSYSGVRPLIDDESGNPAAATRDYRLELTREAGAPLLSVWGGKITTFRKLAEEAGDEVCRALAQGGPAWTEGAPLPGGDLSAWVAPSGRPDTDLEHFAQALARRAPQVGAATLARWARSYGSLVNLILASGNPANLGKPGELGAEVAPGLHEAELRYLQEHEWARSADDVLWRRSKLGLHFTAAERKAVSDWWARHASEAIRVAGPVSSDVMPSRKRRARR
ncbi:MAG: glycerol-3-phosphate dehydrogenase [Burkholderiales bacterium]|nr:glycerol-3-phosphate dehydrogenase [Burkholderiales bacterium]